MVQTVKLRKMNDAEYARWKEWSVADYAKSLIESGKFSESDATAQAEGEFPSYLRNGLSTPNHHVLTAENAGGIPVGMIWYETEDPKRAFIADFVIYDSYRRMGYGRAALAETERILKSAGVSFAELHVFGQNHAAVALYEKCGYTAVDRDADAGSLYMKKQL